MGGAAPDDAQAIREVCAAAADRLLDVADQLRAQAERLRPVHAEAADGLLRVSVDIQEACAFQDYVGQLLTRLTQGVASDPLLAGPATNGGMSQAEIDAMLA